MKLPYILRFVSCAATMLPFTVQAQLHQAYGLRLGVTSARVNFAFTVDNLEDFPYNLETKSRTGVNAAIFAEWGVFSISSLVAQVEYVQGGFVQERTVRDNNIRKVVRNGTKLDYISLPILIKLQYPSLAIGPYLIGGPRLNILIHRSAEIGLHNYLGEQAVDGVIGLGIVSNKLWRFPLLVEARYNFDFTEIHKHNTIQARKNSFDVWLGMMF